MTSRGFKMPKDYDPLRKLAVSQGWDVFVAKGHVHWVSPVTGTHVITPSTPSSISGGLDRARCKLDRAGLVIPGRSPRAGTAGPAPAREAG